MELRAKLKSLRGFLDPTKFAGVNYEFTLTLDEHTSPETLEELQSMDGTELYDVVIKKHREKRSLDSNAYAWVLMSKIAEVVKSSKEEIYEIMLGKYGVFEKDGNGQHIVITLDANVRIANVPGHWFFINGNGDYNSYIMLKGSSEFDTTEMSHFIDGIVYDAKELGIETLPPAELTRMLEAWRP